jgi:hypothetical protein
MKQMNVFRDFTLFEQRFFCHRLPNALHNRQVTVDLELTDNRRQKIVQEAKHRIRETRDCCSTTGTTVST